jgi:hypothetical protein
MEIAITAEFRATAPYVGIVFFLVALYFVWRSFYKMRIIKTDIPVPVHSQVEEKVVA